jgi:large repetitive protein
MAESVSPTGTVLAGPNTILGAAGFSPALAFNGTNYLLVFVGSNPMIQTDQVFAQALSPSSAQAIGSGPVPLVANSGTTSQYQIGITVASDGANFLAVWDDCSAGGGCGIYASRVDSTGTVLDSTAIAIVNAPGSADAPAVAFDGQNYLVAYVDYRPQGGSGNSNISATRISPSGTLLDGTATTAGIAITTTPGSNSSPVSVASMGGESWVTWSSGSVSAETQVGGALVSTAGQVVNPVPAGTPVFASPIAGGQVLTVTVGRAGAGLLAWLALPFLVPTATPASSFGTMAMYP